MNRAFYIIAIPAFVVSFVWLYYDWGVKIAAGVIAAELIVAIGAVVYLRRRVERAGASGQTGAKHEARETPREAGR